MYGIGVHDPRHHLLVGIDVRGRNVFSWSDKINELRCVAARHPFQFPNRHFVRIADDAALGTAKGDVYDGAPPSHPTGQCTYFIQSKIGSITDSSFSGTACNRVLYSETRK